MRRCRICKEPMDIDTIGVQQVYVCNESKCPAKEPQYVKKMGKWKKRNLKIENV